jgi:hypothetical protein
MKRIVTTLALLAIAAPAFATTLVSESFSYLNGGLVPNGGWANYSGAGTDIQISGGRAIGSHASAPDDHLLFPAQPVTAKTYACFDIIIPAVAGAPKPVYFLELKDAGATNLVSRVYVLPVTGGFTFGISHSSTSTTVGVTAWSNTTLLFDHKYNVVINYDPVAHSTQLWVDPVNESSTNVSNTNAATAALAVSGVGLRESNSASALPPSPSYVGTVDITYSIDNLGVGTTFDDACVQYRSTPTNHSTWGGVKQMYR